MKEALLLVFANKQDIPGAMTPTEVTEKLRLAQLKERMWYVVPSCATTGEGLFDGLVSRQLFFFFFDVDNLWVQRRWAGWGSCRWLPAARLLPFGRAPASDPSSIEN
jgi:hypothetical protein